MCKTLNCAISTVSMTGVTQQWNYTNTFLYAWKPTGSAPSQWERTGCLPRFLHQKLPPGDHLPLLLSLLSTTMILSRLHTLALQPLVCHLEACYSASEATSSRACTAQREERVEDPPTWGSPEATWASVQNDELYSHLLYD